MTVLLVALGAAVGAPLRFLAGHLLDDRMPWGTLVANVAGSLLLGVLSALSLSGSGFALLGTGLCGGLTTYSAFVVQSHAHGPRTGTTYAVLTVGLSLAACTVGFVLAQA